MITIKTTAGRIAAASITQAAGDVRYFLNGLAMQKNGGNGLDIISTDGHRLLYLNAADDSFEQTDSDERDKFVLSFPAEALAMFKKVKSRSMAVTIKIGLGEPDASVNVLDDYGNPISVSYTAKVIDGTFPDWRRIIPKVSANIPVIDEIGFNARYLADTLTVARILSPTNDKDAPVKLVGTESGTTGGQLFRFMVADMVADMVIMPIRIKDK